MPVAACADAIVQGPPVSGPRPRATRQPPSDIVPHLVTVKSLRFPTGHSMVALVIYLTLGALLAVPNAVPRSGPHRRPTGRRA